MLSFIALFCKTEYLSDKANTAGRAYHGSIVYNMYQGQFAFESTDFAGGRITGNFNVQYHITDHLGNVRVVLNNSMAILEQNDYYPFGQRQPNPSMKTTSNRYRYNNKEQLAEVETIDYGARTYNAELCRWLQMDPLAEKYKNQSSYNFCANNPIKFVDPDGRKIVGITKKDALNFKADIYNVLQNEKFANIRALIDVKGSTFKSIDANALSAALDGVLLNDDERTYIDMVTNTINSKDIHKIEYLNGDFTSSDGALSFRTHMNKSLVGLGDMMLTPEGKLSTEIIDNYGGGLNVPTKNGSHSFIGKGVVSEERAIISGHEVFGHGIPSAKQLDIKENNANAIRADNLIRRLLGISERDGSNHGGFKEGHIIEPNVLPITQ